MGARLRVKLEKRRQLLVAVPVQRRARLTAKTVERIREKLLMERVAACARS